MLPFDRNSVKKVWHSWFPNINSGNPQIFDNSKAIAAIEVVILLTISRSIDIKKNYFANSSSLNAGSLEVVGFRSSSYGVNIHQGKKNTRTTPNEQKQYSTLTRT